jgi:hypothetical protein
VRTAEIPPPRDPEFDHPPRPARGKPGRDVALYHQRLLVNPFLTSCVAVLVVALAAVMQKTWGVGPTAAKLVGFFVAMPLLQFHCLDCGSTDWYRRWKGHTCPKVVERFHTPFASASHIFPTPTTQLALWALALAIAIYLMAALPS